MRRPTVSVLISHYGCSNDFQVYCRHCYAVLFGHKQKSNYTGWMDVKAIPGEDGDRTSCPRCHGKVPDFYSTPLTKICLYVQTARKSLYRKVIA